MPRTPGPSDPEAPAGPAARSWHIVQLKPGGLTLAERNLLRQGFEVFFPRRALTRRSGGRLVSQTEPLFPGYGFVALDPGRSWSPINGTLGVARLLTGSDRRPAPLPPGFVDSLRSRCDAAGLLTAALDLAPGDRVRIASGPFSDLIARIERLEGLGRVTVLLELLGQPVRMSLPGASLSGKIAPGA